MNINSDDIINDFAHGDNNNKIYLNNASVSLMPLQSIDAMKEFLIQYSGMGPDSLSSESFLIKKFHNVRKVISDIINCQPDEIVITQSVTDGINFVSNGLSFTPDSEIIIRGLSHEHHSNYYPWLQLGQKYKLCNLPIDNNGFFQIDKLNQTINKNTKLLSLSHGLYNTGAILPVEKIGQILAEHTIPYFVDAAQTVGCTDLVNVQNMHCDFMSFNGSKWLCGPMGTGIFYCNRKSSELLTPTNIGGESAMLYENNKLAYKELPDKFQTGFRNYVGLAGLESSVNYLTHIGITNIRKKIIKLANILRDELQNIPGVTIHGPENENQRTSIVSFSIDEFEPQYVVEKLEKNNVILAVREIMDQKIIRASPHLFNSEKDILQVVDLLKQL